MAIPIQSNRLYYYDLLRLFLVLLALTSHFMTSQKWGNLLDNESYLLIKLFTRTSMPCLLIIFGFMFEYVYAKRWVAKGSFVIFQRMLSRTVLCYLAFVSLSFVGYLVGYQNFSSFSKSILLLTPALHVNLFKYYALLIPLIFVIMWARFKFGFWVSFSISITVITIAEIASRYITHVPSEFKHIGGLLLGLGNTWGPSIAHALILVVSGMYVADYVLNRKLNKQVTILVILVLCAVCALTLEIGEIGIKQFTVRIENISYYRASNSFIYFAYGLITFLIFWQLARLVSGFFSNSIKQKISFYGGNTFTIFYYGNFIILLTPGMGNNLSLKLSVVLLFFTLISAMVFVNIIELLNRKFALDTKFDYYVLQPFIYISSRNWFKVIFRSKKQKR